MKTINFFNLDLPGKCGSNEILIPAATSDFENYSMNQHAKDLINAIKALGISKCSLSTHSAQSTLPVEKKEVGMNSGGGIVFYIDATGKHGLVAVPHDQAVKVPWGANSITGADSPSDGAANSAKIIRYFEENVPGKIKPAARYCDTLAFGGYTDWYLPSIMELRKMYQVQDVIGGFKLGDYCSSTEYGREDAYAIHFRPHNRVEFYYNKVNSLYNVRCIRKY